MNLNAENWKEFLLADYFDIVAGKYHYPDEYDVGNTPYISASSENNGVAQKIDLVADFRGNCIVTGKVGCTAFYQPDDFCATSDVNIFYPKFNLNEKIGLFIVAVINFNENYKWGYGRQCRVGDSKEIVVKLPATADGSPDWDFMEQYIKSLNHKPLTTQNSHHQHSLNIDSWQKFSVRDLFEVKYGINMELNACVLAEDGDCSAINFVAHTEDNNGVSAKVYPVEGKIPQPAGIITCAGGGSVLSTFLQEKPFYSGRDLYLLIPKYSMGKAAKLFIITIIKANKYRYSYGRQANVTLPYLELLLPTTSEGKPDFEFMENYIKSLPYGDRI